MFGLASTWRNAPAVAARAMCTHLITNAYVSYPYVFALIQWCIYGVLRNMQAFPGGIPWLRIGTIELLRSRLGSGVPGVGMAREA